MTKLDDLKKEARKFFSKYGKVVSPAFPKERITLNAKGINHLFYKNARNTRNLKEIQTRVDLLPRAVKLLELLPIYQEESSYLSDYHQKEIYFWSFEGVVDGKRIKVVVRKIGQGNKHFWSVIPNWRQNRFGKILNAKGNLSKAD